MFDESTDVISGSVQLQHAFPFDEKTPIGTEAKRRIDVFYKVGDDYRHVAKRITVRNMQIKTTAAFDDSGLSFTLPTKLPGEWTLGTVRLARLSGGQFRNIAIEPESSMATAANARLVWNAAKVASEFGYASSEEAGMKLVANRTAWVSAEYKGPVSGETLTVVKLISAEDKF